MAGLRKCKHPETPHHTDDPFEMFCMQCGYDFEPAEAAPEQTAVPAAAPVASAPEEPADRVYATIMQPGEREVIAQFPWGEERFSERLAIGRDPGFSPIAERLAAFPTVSAFHAELHLTPEGATVIHRGRSNPTYVDGREIPRDVEVRLGDRAQLHFSNLCACSIRIGS